MKKYIATIITFSLLLNACKTDDLELSNGSGVSAETFPQTLAELQQTMNGVYSPLQSQGLYGRYLFYMYDYMGDEIKGQTLVLTTTNGTRAIEVAKGVSNMIVIGSFLNLSAIACLKSA